MPSISVPANALSLVIPVTPPQTVYTPLVNPSWNTPVAVVAVTPSTFTVQFSVPAPAGALLYYQVELGTFSTPTPGGQLDSLASYLDDLRRLLHDPNDVYWPVSDKTRYINKAIQARDVDAMCNRQLIPFTLTPGKDVYTFSDIGQGQVFDVVAIALIFGATRVILGNLSYTMLTANYRQWKLYRGIPECWARHGPSTVFIAPTATIAYDTEWDCICYSSPLVNLTDVDVMPFPYTKPVAFYAAYLAKYNERQIAEAEEFKSQYDAKVLEATNSRVGLTPSAYGTDFVRVW